MSRASAYFSRIGSEEARAFSTNPVPLSLSSSANPGLTSGDSLILYCVADPFSLLLSLPSHRQWPKHPSSHYSLVTTEGGSLPLPDPASRKAGLSMYSNLGDSIFSVSLPSSTIQTDKPLNDDKVNTHHRKTCQSAPPHPSRWSRKALRRTGAH